MGRLCVLLGKGIKQGEIKPDRQSEILHHSEEQHASADEQKAVVSSFHTYIVDIGHPECDSKYPQDTSADYMIGKGIVHLVGDPSYIGDRGICHNNVLMSEQCDSVMSESIASLHEPHCP